MFGGVGIYRDGVMFGLLSSTGAVHLKADATTIPKFAAEGSEPFSFERQGRTMTTSYWRIPERLLDDPDDLRPWALEAHAVAVRAQADKKPKRKKPAKGAG